MLFFCLPATALVGADTNWIGPAGGLFTTASNWDNGVPTAGTTGILNSSALLNAAYAGIPDEMWIGRNSGTGSLTVNAGSIAIAGALNVGNGAVGTVSLDNSTLTCGSLNYGTSTGGGTGTIEMTNSTLTVNGGSYGGYEGPASTGHLIMHSGATFNANSHFYLGHKDGGVGTLDMDGNSVINVSNSATLLFGTEGSQSAVTMTGTLGGAAPTINAPNSWFYLGCRPFWQADSGTGKVDMTLTDGARINAYYVSLGGSTQTCTLTLNNAYLSTSSGGGLIVRDNAVLNLNGSSVFETSGVNSWGGTTGAINFNGGTMKCSMTAQGDPPYNTPDNPWPFQGDGAYVAFNVLDGGAGFDTNGYNMNLNRELLAATGSVGGFTKKGLGTMYYTAVTPSTYTGATVVERGTLALMGTDISASSGIAVKSGATLAGYTDIDSYNAYPATTIEAGGTFAASAAGSYYISVDSLNFENNTNLNFTIDTLGNCSQINVVNNVAKVGANPINVTVTYGGSLMNDVTVLRTNGSSIDPQITFSLPGGLPVIDSDDGVHAEASIYTDYANGNVQLKAGTTFAATQPCWNQWSGGSWNNGLNWGPPNDVPNQGDERGMFVQSLSSGEIPVSLNVSPTVSSLIFASPGGESYKIAPVGSETITLNSSIAQNWHITVLGGSHAVEAGLKLGAGTGQSAIRLVDGSQLTLSGVIGDATTAAGLNFVGNFNAGTGTGVLTLGGNNTYTGPTTATGGVLEVTKLANHGAASSFGATADASPANLLLNGATLRYIGTTAASTDRGFTVQGNSALQIAQNATFTGQISGAYSSTLNVSGPGLLTLGYVGVSTAGNLNVANSGLTLAANSQLRIEGGEVGCNSNTSSLTLNEGSVLTSAGRVNFGYMGNTNISLSGTSTTSPTILSVGGSSWIGAHFDTPAPSSATIDLSGTSEMRVGMAEPMENMHIGVGAQTTFDLAMTDDSKFTCNIIAHDDIEGWGWLTIADNGGSATLSLGDRASFSAPYTFARMAGSTNSICNLNISGSANFSAGRAIWAATNPGTQATILMEGPGSKMTSGGDLFIGTGGNASASLTMKDGANVEAAGRFLLGMEGAAALDMSGTSKITIGDTAWIGFSQEGGTAASATVTMSGQSELRLGTAGPMANTHLGLGTGSTFGMTMTGESKFSCEIVAHDSIAGYGWLCTGDAGATAVWTLSDRASVSVPNSYMAIATSTAGKGHVILNDSATCSAGRGVVLGGSETAEASIDLNGGTFIAPWFSTEGPGVLNFNGGIVKASAASDNYIAGASFTVNIADGGAGIDTNGFDVVIQRDLNKATPDSIGGLTKLGDGQLTLTGALNYAGDTVVNQGVLNVASLDTPLAAVSVKDGATLNAASIRADLLTIGGVPTAASAVPEPGMLTLLALALLGGVVVALKK
jgi:autotransporter-associated beta strand protein/T5SS/PEP-CTERM-associated repeat protein